MQEQQFTPEAIVTVYMTTQVNEERLVDDPPLMRTEIACDALRQAVESTVHISAKAWDMYRDIVQLSFLHDGRAYHFMLCEGEGEAITQIEDSPRRRVRVYANEDDLVQDAFQFLNDIYGSYGGRPMYYHMLAGWRMTAEIWPVLVNRAIKYKIPCFKEMLIMPNVKWSQGNYIGDLSNLYLQGGQGLRKLPGLADVLKYWGYWHDESKPMPEDIGAAVCERPLATALAVEVYLRDMHEVMTAYCCGYNTNPQAQAGSLAGMPVPQ